MRHSTQYVLLAALLVAPPAGAQEEVTASPVLESPPSEPPPAEVASPVGAPSEGVTSEAGLDDIAKMAEHFSGSVFIFEQSVTPDTLDKNAQLSRVPSYQWSLSFRPRYYIVPTLSVRLRMDLDLEWLNAADTTRAHEALFGDTRLDVAYNPPDIWGIKSTVSARAMLPTSKDTIAQGSVIQLGPVVSLIRPFDDVKVGGFKIGSFEVTAGAYTLFNLAQYTSGGVGTSFSCTSMDYTPTYCSENTGRMNPRVSLVGSLAGKYSPIPEISLGLSYTQLNAWAYDTPTVTTKDKWGRTVTLDDGKNDTRFRQSEWAVVSIDYDPVDWLSLGVSYATLRSVLDPNSHYGNPFYSPGGNSRLAFAATFNLDASYDKVARHFQPSAVPSAE